MAETEKATRSPRKRTSKKTTAAAGSNGGSRVSDEQKAAMAQGRTESAIVRRYLEALETVNGRSGRRGRRRTPESINKRLIEISAMADGTDAVTRLKLTQERITLERELAELESKDSVDISGLEKEFVGVAKSFSERQGITYTAWREVGVAADVLREAGVSRATR